MEEEKKVIKKIPLNQIEMSAGTQIRFQIDEETVLEYAQDLKNGDEFPPVVAFYNGKKYYLADGFHRCLAHQKNKKRSIKAEVRKGRLKDAVLYAASSNTRHGLKRTREDKRRSVEILLKDKEWRRWSNREIAKHCKVDHKTVGKIRNELSGEFPQIEKRKVKRGDSIYLQKTSKKSSKKKKSSAEFPRSNLKKILPKTLVNQLEKYSSKHGVEEAEVMKKALKLFFEQEGK